MSVIRNIETNIVPMPSRIEITFKSFINGTRIPNVDDALVKYQYQDYNLSNGQSVGANVIELDSTDLTKEDSDAVFGIFIKYFDEKYKKKHGIS